MPDKQSDNLGTSLGNFTRAVKTIVNVPKSTIPSKRIIYKPKENSKGELECPMCGEPIARTNSHNHEHNRKK